MINTVKNWYYKKTLFCVLKIHNFNTKQKLSKYYEKRYKNVRYFCSAICVRNKEVTSGTAKRGRK